MATNIPQPEFGQRLRQLRSERGLSQRDLAVGAVNQSYISLLESGARVPTLEVVLHLARVLGVPLDALIADAPLITEGTTDQVRCEQLVQHLLASSAIDVGDLSQAQDQLTRVYQSAVASGPPTAVISHGLALDRVLSMRLDASARYTLLKDLLGVATGAGVPEALVRIRIELGSAARDVGQLAEALTHTEAAMQEIRQTAFWQGIEHVRLLGVHISALSDAGGGMEVIRFVDTMMELADTIGSPAISGRAHWVASVALARLGESERSLEHLRAAHEILANPSTSLREWARFSRAAASALMDAAGDLPEITKHMQAARAATAVAQTPRDATLCASLEVRYALASRDAKRALELSADVDESQLKGLELVRFALAVGRALDQTGRRSEAVAALRRAAVLAEEASAYRRASQIWREVHDLTVAD